MTGFSVARLVHMLVDCCNAEVIKLIRGLFIMCLICFFAFSMLFAGIYRYDDSY